MSLLDNILQELIEKYRDEDTIIDRYEQDYSISPEDVLVERESRLEAISLIKFSMEYLTEEDKELIRLYVVLGNTLKQVGVLLGYHETTIMRKLNKIPSKLKKLYNKHAINSGFKTNNIEGLSPALSSYSTFEEMRDLLFYKTPKVHLETTSMGFPFEIMMKQWKWSSWYKYKVGKNAGLVIWKTANQCLVKEYLATAFHTEKGEVCCTLCPKCTGSEKYIKISKL